MPEREPRPRSRPRPSPFILALLPFIAVITFGCVFNAARWVYHPYPGFFLWENNFVPAVDVIGSPATRAGLRYQSRLLAVDGAPVRDRDQVEALIAARSLGSEFRYTLQRGADVYDVRLPSARLSLSTFGLTLGNYLLNGLVFLALGIAIVFLDPQSRGARAFFFFCVSYGLYLVTAIDLMGPSWFQVPYFFFITLLPAATMHLAVDFPAMAPEFRRLRRLLPIFYVAGALLGLGTVLTFSRAFETMLVLDRITHLAMVTSLFAALTIGVLSLRRATDPVARSRLRLFLTGLAGAALVPALVLLAVYTADAPVPLNYLTLGFGIFAAVIAYAIARYELFGADRVVRRTVAYVVVTFIIGLIYTAVLAVLDYVVLPDLAAAPAVHVLVTMVLLALFNPLRGRIQAVVDLLFFRAPYDYRTTVTAASQALASILDLDALVARLLRITRDAMQVERVEVWLRDPLHGDFRCEGSGATLPADSALIEHLERSGQSLHVVQRLVGEWAPAAARRVLVSLDAVLAVPMLFEQRLIGFLALGEKQSGRLYSRDDLDLLATVASQAAVAVQNARAYRALEETNRALRVARDRLVEAERLAAIGELSAAVAHGIRNPVAGIKTAAEYGVRTVKADNPVRESFLDILAEADALESRISELLDFAHPFVPRPGAADLNDAARGVLHLLRRDIAARGIEVSLDLAEDLPAHEFDAAQIEQVGLALVTNALEAMGQGGHLNVRTRYVPAAPAGSAAAASNGADAEGGLEWSIRDTGPGIAPDQLPRIFRLFYTRKARGTGVGLAVVKRIVEGHGGRIDVSSEVGHGSEFRVRLPLRSPVAPAANDALDTAVG